MPIHPEPLDGRLRPEFESLKLTVPYSHLCAQRRRSDIVIVFRSS